MWSACLRPRLLELSSSVSPWFILELNYSYIAILLSQSYCYYFSNKHTQTHTHTHTNTHIDTHIHTLTS